MYFAATTDPSSSICAENFTDDNHVCDDGGRQGVKSKCTWGTDCDDCGARKPGDADTCKEEPDRHGHTCAQYHYKGGHSCQELVRRYHINCLCTCPDLYKNNVVQGGRRRRLQPLALGSGHATTENDTAERQEKAVDYTPAFMEEEEQEEQGEGKEEYYTVSFDDFPVQAQGPEMP